MQEANVAPGPTWVPCPVRARVVRAGRRKVEDVHLVRLVPCALRRLDDTSAPVLAATAGVGPFVGPGHAVTQVVAQARWTLLGHARTLAGVRFDGHAWWRPVSTLDRVGCLAIDAIQDQLAEVRRNDYLEWPDWPFAVDRKSFANAKIPLLTDEGSSFFRETLTDIDAAMTQESGRLASLYAEAGGLLHVRCREPVNEVVAAGLSKGKVREVLVIPTVDGLPGSLSGDDVLQVYRADAVDEAVSYAEEMARAFKVGVYAGHAFVSDGGGLARDDRLAAVAEAHSRLVERGAPLVGPCPRPVVEAWLDLRDASDGGDAFTDALARLVDAAMDANPRSRIAVHAWCEAARLVPDRFVRGRRDIPPEDVAAFAAL